MLCSKKPGNLTSHRVLRLGVSTNQANSVEPTPADPFLWLNGRGENIKVGKVFLVFLAMANEVKILADG